MKVTAFIAAASVLIAGCSTYEAPSVNHTYVTNTQDYHDLAGLRIQSYPPTNGFADYTIGLAIGVREYQAFYIDGRSVLTTNGFKPVETFLQLPPGVHEVLLTEKLKGSLTLGTPVDAGTDFRYRVRFTLGRGATATLIADGSNIVALNGVENYDVLEGPQALGHTLVNQPKRANPSESNEAGSLEDQLTRLRDLHAKGLVSDEAYQRRISEILSQLK